MWVKRVISVTSQASDLLSSQSCVTLKTCLLWENSNIHKVNFHVPSTYLQQFPTGGQLSSSILGFLNLGTTDTLGWKVLCCGRLSCAFQYIQQYPWPLPLDASSPHPLLFLVMATKNVPCWISHPQLRTTDLHSVHSLHPFNLIWKQISYIKPNPFWVVFLKDNASNFVGPQREEKSKDLILFLYELLLWQLVTPGHRFGHSFCQLLVFTWVSKHKEIGITLQPALNFFFFFFW